MFNGLILCCSVPLYFVKASKPSAITKHKFKATHILYFDSRMKATHILYLDNRMKSASHYSCFNIWKEFPVPTGQKAGPVPDHVQMYSYSCPCTCH